MSACIKFFFHLLKPPKQKRLGCPFSVLPMVHGAIRDTDLLGKLLLGQMEPPTQFPNEDTNTGFVYRHIPREKKRTTNPAAM